MSKYKSIRSATDPTPEGIEKGVISVSRLNELAKDTLERHFGNISVEGEISNLVKPSSGHIYFSLKDGSSVVRCAMFRRQNRQNTYDVENGQQIIATGKITIYSPRGDYQLIVSELKPNGEGELRIRLEQLKQKLYKEGLFSESKKQKLPDWPKKIGIISSVSGAAVRDILNVLARRSPHIPIIIYPTSVQGENASAEIVEAISKANARRECDVLILARGGGSLEDLLPFSNESLVRAVFESECPIVTGIGHEIDFSLADFAADARAPTPSAAAELVSPDSKATEMLFGNVEKRLLNELQKFLAKKKERILELKGRLITPKRRLEIHQQRVDELHLRIDYLANTKFRITTDRVETLFKQIKNLSPNHVITSMQKDIGHLESRLHLSIENLIKSYEKTLSQHNKVLSAVGPQATLKRGYAIVSDNKGTVLRNVSACAEGDTVYTRLDKGHFSSVVLKKNVDREELK